MSPLPYRQILKKAWEITWANKILWIFGFFAVALLGNNRAYNLIIDNLDVISRQDMTDFFTFRLYKQTLTSGSQIAGLFADLWNFIINNPLDFFLSVLFFLAVAAIILALIWLTVISQISLLRNVKKVNENKKIGFKESVKEARKYFWPTLALNFFIQVIIYSLFLIFIYPAAAYIPFFSGATIFLFILFFLIFIPLSIVIAFLTIYASSYIVLKDQKFLPAIKSAWRLFIKNWLPSVEMGLILFLVDIGATLGFIIIFFLLFIPFILLGIIFYFIAGSSGLFLIAILALVCLIALTLIFTAALSTFQYSAWTLTFLQLTEKSATSKIIEVLGSWIKSLKKIKK